jgi:hypothetical protein
MSFSSAGSSGFSNSAIAEFLKSKKRFVWRNPFSIHWHFLFYIYIYIQTTNIKIENLVVESFTISSSY